MAERTQSVTSAFTKQSRTTAAGYQQVAIGAFTSVVGDANIGARPLQAHTR